MAEFSVIRDALPQAEEIVRTAEKYADLFYNYRKISDTNQVFDPFRPTTHEDDDAYHGLTLNVMPNDLADLVSSALQLNKVNAPHFVRLQRYGVGDYVLPHRDPQHQSLFILTSSDVDGLTTQTPAGDVVTIPDRAGTYIRMDFRNWHWVDPVKEGPRYSLTTIPSLKIQPPAASVAQPQLGELLGSGDTGKVYGLAGGERVVKVCRATRTYALFLRFVQSFPSPHLPSMYDIGKIGGGLQRIEMERLVPIEETATELWQEYEKFSQVCHAEAEGRRAPNAEYNMSPLLELAVALGKNARANNIPLDLDRANVMCRPGTNDLVITDPYW